VKRFLIPYDRGTLNVRFRSRPSRWQHQDVVRKNLDQYIIKDPDVVKGLSVLNAWEKTLCRTNSDYSYSKLLLDYAINPFLKEHKSWQEIVRLRDHIVDETAFFFH